MLNEAVEYRHFMKPNQYMDQRQYSDTYESFLTSFTIKHSQTRQSNSDADISVNLHRVKKLRY